MNGRTTLVLSVALAGCGRIAFDPLLDDQGDAATDTAMGEPCDGHDTSDCTVIPCAATSACLVYCGIATDLTAVQAQSNCAGRGGNLAQLTSAALVSCVADGRGGSQGAWVGLGQSPGATTPDQNWQWRSGTPFDPSGWAPSEPNDASITIDTEDGEEQCGALVLAGFNDGKCTVATGDWACEL